jgi:hypothetical protein
MAITAEAITETMLASMERSQSGSEPYKHWYLTSCLPADAISATTSLPFDAPELGGLSGKRELHNKTRTYFDAENMQRHPVCKAFNEAFQSDRLSHAIASFFGTNLDGSFLRVEYAQDIDGFWLEPHTDLGVKLFTMLLYLSDNPSHSTLGTDIYDAEKKHVTRSPFAPNSAMVFVPSDITYHGFEPRKIEGIRKSIIVNYVTAEWRAREQLAYSDQPIRQ